MSNGELRAGVAATTECMSFLYTLQHFEVDVNLLFFKLFLFNILQVSVDNKVLDKLTKIRITQVPIYSMNMHFLFPNWLFET